MNIDWALWGVITLAGILAYIGIGRYITLFFTWWGEKYDQLEFFKEKWFAWFNLYFWPAAALAILLVVGIFLTLLGIGLAVVLCIIIVALTIFLVNIALSIIFSPISGIKSIIEIIRKSPPYYDKEDNKRKK